MSASPTKKISLRKEQGINTPSQPIFYLQLALLRHVHRADKSRADTQLLNQPSTLALGQGARLVSLLLLLPPLPLQHNPNEVLEIKVRPQTLNEDDLRVLMALPEHKVAESRDAASPHEEF